MSSGGVMERLRWDRLMTFVACTVAWLVVIALLRWVGGAIAG